MTRIALIAGTYAPDRCGVAHYTERLRTVLAQRRIDSIVLTTVKAAQKSDPSVLGVVQDWNWQNLLPLVRAIYQTKADLLHIQHAAGTYGFDLAIFLLPLLLKRSGWQKPIVTTIHEYGLWEWQPQWIPESFLEWLKTWGQQHQWWDREDGFLLTQGNAIITTNYEAEQVILERLPHLKSYIHRIPIGANINMAWIDRITARKNLRQACNWSEDTTVIAFFGFLHPVKGLETLLSAFQRVSETHPQARLLLIGGVESLALRGTEAKQYWEKLENTISQLHLEAKVHLTGYINPELASQYLTGADMGVLPFNHGVTLKSGSLLALMAHCLPVIATRSSDVHLNHANVVRTIEHRDVDSLTLALTELLSDPIARNQLAQTGQDFIRQFDWAAIVDAHVAIYQLCLMS
jgi:glycosyltransferase involved in cell wall biosynthesis